jgi:hypothetical protein
MAIFFVGKNKKGKKNPKNDEKGQKYAHKKFLFQKFKLN